MRKVAVLGLLFLSVPGWAKTITLSDADMKTLAGRAARELGKCRELRGAKTVLLADISNRTEEHLDKSVLVRELQAALARKAVKLMREGEGSAPAAPELSVALTSEKQESPQSSTATYTLELELGRCKRATVLKK